VIELPDETPENARGKTENARGKNTQEATYTDPITKETQTVRVINIDTSGPGTIIQHQR